MVFVPIGVVVEIAGLGDQPGIGVVEVLRSMCGGSGAEDGGGGENREDELAHGRDLLIGLMMIGFRRVVERVRRGARSCPVMRRGSCDSNRRVRKIFLSVRVRVGAGRAHRACWNVHQSRPPLRLWKQDQ
jgi:hypothetical protein